MKIFFCVADTQIFVTDFSDLVFLSDTKWRFNIFEVCFPSFLPENIVGNT